MDQDAEDIAHPKGLQEAIESYERAVLRRRTRARPTEEVRLPATLPTPARRRPRLGQMRVAVAAGGVLLSATLFLNPRERGAPVGAQGIDGPDLPSEAGYRRDAVAPSDTSVPLRHRSTASLTRIVLDPGHGGFDAGVRTDEESEAAFVLDVATRLQARLEEGDLEVVLTRHDDVDMPLRARTERANNVGADLFLSIHATASPRASAPDLATYYLDFATDPTAQAAAARENAASREGMHELPQLVRLMATRSAQQESRDLAAVVHRHLIRGIRTVDPNAEDRGVTPAPFVVLIGATMPGVLVQLSFPSARREPFPGSRDEAYRDQIANALSQAVLEYRQTLTTPRR